MSILNLISALGIVALCYIVWLGAEDRRNIPWHTIFWGIVLQLIVSAIVFVCRGFVRLGARSAGGYCRVGF
jgi:CNT family concentrative nucleoside transporter